MSQTLTNNKLVDQRFSRKEIREKTNERIEQNEDGYNSYVGNNRRLAVSSHS